jgi:hypothetical protein
MKKQHGKNLLRYYWQQEYMNNRGMVRQGERL